jgi:hypothetical protein
MTECTVVQSWKQVKLASIFAPQTSSLINVASLTPKDDLIPSTTQMRLLCFCLLFFSRPGWNALTVYWSMLFWFQWKCFRNSFSAIIRLASENGPRMLACNVRAGIGNTTCKFVLHGVDCLCINSHRTCTHSSPWIPVSDYWENWRQSKDKFCEANKARASYTVQIEIEFEPDATVEQRAHAARCEISKASKQENSEAREQEGEEELRDHGDAPTVDETPRFAMLLKEELDKLWKKEWIGTC